MQAVAGFKGTFRQSGIFTWGGGEGGVVQCGCTACSVRHAACSSRVGSNAPTYSAVQCGAAAVRRNGSEGLWKCASVTFKKKHSSSLFLFSFLFLLTLTNRKLTLPPTSLSSQPRQRSQASSTNPAPFQSHLYLGGFQWWNGRGESISVSVTTCPAACAGWQRGILGSLGCTCTCRWHSGTLRCSKLWV